MGRCHTTGTGRIDGDIDRRTPSSSTSGDSVIGDDEATDGPFGPRRVTYADYTASGRSLTFIEDYLRAAVLPRYANTHTESSGTGCQTTRFREEARAIIATAVGAITRPARGHLRGLGLHRRHPQARGRARAATARRARRALRAARPDPGRRSDRWCSSAPTSTTPTSCRGASRSRMWSPSTRTPTVVSTWRSWSGSWSGTPTGHCASGPSRPPRTSPASCPTRARCRCCSIDMARCRCGTSRPPRHTSAIEMAPHRAAPDGDTSESHLDEKDAVFISVHKLIGGPGHAGRAGGHAGTCSGTGCPRWSAAARSRTSTARSSRTSRDPEHREEAGTPDIIGSIRAGLAFQLKEQVGEAAIAAREGSFIRRAIERWERRARHRHPG